MSSLVVGWDSNIDELGWRVGVTEGNDWDVNVRSLTDCLCISARVGDNDETWFLEGARDVVGEVTRGETPGDGVSTSVVGKLQNGTLTVWTSRDDDLKGNRISKVLRYCIVTSSSPGHFDITSGLAYNVGWVVNGGDDTGGKDNLLPV